MLLDVNTTIKNNNFIDFFKNSESLKKALENPDKSICSYYEILVEDILITCGSVRCSECPLNRNNRHILLKYLPFISNTLLPKPIISEIVDIEKYFPTIIEL